ncbi:MAG: hypothetical protein KAJ78_04450 [Acidobacteria bacterium]|nr:hypothetical protein [Acidobacteriota bacterium]
MTDPNIPDSGMSFAGKGRLRDEEKPVLTDLCEWVGADAEEENLEDICDRPICRRQASLPQGEAGERIGMANEGRYLPNEFQNEIVPTDPEPVVDLHTHLFDAQYLSLQEILEDKGTAGGLVEPATRLLGLLARKAGFIPGSQFSREEIPILTHCSPVGLGPFKGSEYLCDPDYWLGALNDFHDLTLCYGHAGGGGEKTVDPETGSEVLYFGWCSENDEEWGDDHNFAHKVVEHCCRFPNVFCDFSYFGAIVKDREKAIHLKRNLFAALGGPDGDLHFGRKVMYGSDRHIPKMAGHPVENLAFWRELFDDPRIASYRDAFFFKNALRFLGLESMVQRHERGSTPVLSASTTHALRKS